MQTALVTLIFLTSLTGPASLRLAQNSRRTDPEIEPPPLPTDLTNFDWIAYNAQWSTYMQHQYQVNAMDQMTKYQKSMLATFGNLEEAADKLDAGDTAEVDKTGSNAKAVTLAHVKHAVRQAKRVRANKKKKSKKIVYVPDSDATTPEPAKEPEQAAEEAADEAADETAAEDEEAADPHQRTIP